MARMSALPGYDCTVMDAAWNGVRTRRHAVSTNCMPVTPGQMSCRPKQQKANALDGNSLWSRLHECRPAALNTMLIADFRKGPQVVLQMLGRSTKLQSELHAAAAAWHA